jgi:hypothetical protein
MIPILLTALLGSVWRRWLGLGQSGKRAAKFMCGFLLTWPLWSLPFDPLVNIALSILALAFWAPGHKVDTPKVWLRYGPFGIGYFLAHKYWKWNFGRFLDGWMAAGEYATGFLYWGTIACLSLLFPPLLS